MAIIEMLGNMHVANSLPYYILLKDINVFLVDGEMLIFDWLRLVEGE